MCYLNIVLLIFLFCADTSPHPADEYYSEPYNYLQSDSGRTYYFKGQMIDTVTEKKISQLCDHCAMAIRFKVLDSTIKSEFIELIVFIPNYDKMKFYKPKGIYSIKANSIYKGPRVLIIPAGHHKDNVPIYWCDNIAPGF
jgi:hypothetical protein